MAFGEIGKLVNVVNDLGYLIVGSDKAYVQKKTATAKKGDVKVIEEYENKAEDTRESDEE